MQAPQHLAHKPIFEVKDYNKIDGKYAGPNSDAKALSVGIAQWNNVYKTDLSAKVWRKSGERWSRQSEELPLHRVIDLATMICALKLSAETGEQPNAFGLDVSEAINDPVLNEILQNELRNDLGLTESLERLRTVLLSHN